jgi:UDP-2,4-diacetamido-2,4,6-trideoxy-beta-L-altropyranose hydrolase
LNRFLFRADATTELGTGHIMRCLALAQGLIEEGKEVTFLSRCSCENLRHRIEASGACFMSVDKPHPDPDDLRRTLRLVAELRIRWLVLDGYHFDPVFHRAIQKAGCRLLVIDDTAHLSEYHADVLLNQNITAGKLSYACTLATKLLLGPRYVLLRPEFLNRRGWRRDIPAVAHKVLVSMGGGDPDNVTLKVIQALQQADGLGLGARIVVGFANPHLKILNDVIKHSRHNIELVINVHDMSDQMAWADLAVTSAGSTCWELAFMGLPSCNIIIADNQLQVAETLHEKGVAINLGWSHAINLPTFVKTIRDLSTDQKRRAVMSHRGRLLVDGYGVQTVVAALNEFDGRRR